jgi:acyl-CoA reductase-like NAD-dependent aldehyde dehydrogenase
MTMPAQIDVVRRHIDDALARGGRAVVGGPDSVQPPYVQPVVLVDVPEDSAAVQEETFGPTLTITKVRDVDEAIERTNANPFGLGGAVFSAKQGEQIAERLSCGMVSINSAVTFATVPGLPFGGVRNSGFGRIHGADGLREFAWPRAVTHLRYTSPIKGLTFKRTPRDTAWLKRLVKTRWGR